MLDLRLDPFSHDLVIEALDLALTRDNEEAHAQHIKQRLLMITGEWFLNMSDGLPWFDGILGKPQDVSTVENLLKFRIVESPGVRELLAFDMGGADAERTLNVSFTVRLFDGTTVSSSLEITP